jgi:phage shock protein PspC (stress-responsive transcriptional regulator)
MDENNFPDIFQEPDNESQQNLPSPKKLERSRTDVIIAGVCSGIAKYINTDTSVIRLFAILSLLFGFGVLQYILLRLS